jgi:ubiquinone/menaquinone biosynthesis C-methylase UbiE
MNDAKEKVQQQFGQNAAAYATSTVHAKGASLARMVELAQPQPDWQALDIATAAGHTAFAFAPHVAHVIASDLTPEMLVVAEKLAAEKGITNVSFRQADAENLPFEANQFDLVTCRIAPHHFPDIDRFLQECARVLRPQGSLALVDNISPDDKIGSDHYNAFEKLRDPSHGRCLSTEEWEQALFAAGFDLLHQEIGTKSIEFDDWADRMQVTSDDKIRLRVMLVQAPAPALAFLTPTFAGDRINFSLSEALFIARAREKVS